MVTSNSSNQHRRTFNFGFVAEFQKSYRQTEKHVPTNLWQINGFLPNFYYIAIRIIDRTE